jgi:hypothetical protein
MARQRERIRLEDGLKLDLNKLGVQTIQHCEPVHRIIYWGPQYWGNARKIGLLICRLFSATRGSMRLLLRSSDQLIDMVAESRHFGGVQWYFLCPMTGRRASVLWMPPGQSCFASRQAWGSQFAYGSQFETPPYRAMSRAKDIRLRLGDEQYTSIFFNPPPLKPKGMHWRTFNVQAKRLEAYEEKRDSFARILISRSNKA